jgi:hypothetical protein
MVTEATKELFALLNGLCGAVLVVVLLAYLALARPRRSAVALALLVMIVFCALNAIVVYFLL